MHVQQFSDVSSDFSSIAATAALPAFGVLLVVAVVPSLLLSRRADSALTAVEWFIGLATLAVIVAVTSLRGELRLGFAPINLIDWIGDFDNLSRDPLGSSQFMLNVALFVPAGVVWGWLTKRPLRTCGALALMSFVIECFQGLTGAGANDLVDLIANSAGAAVGSGLAAVILQLASRRSAATMPPKVRVITAACAVAVSTAVAIGWFAGASARQQNVEGAVRTEFEGTKLQDIERRLDEDPSSVWSASGDFTSGSYSTPESRVVRYPATFFSLHRCVFVTWTAASVDFRKASGSECTDFIDNNGR